MSTSLPIHAREQDILDAAKKHQVIIIEGETGCGKSTVVPKLLLDGGICRRGKMIVTEPRRIAAVELGTYVAEQSGESVGGTFGYRIRHRDCTTPRTRCAYVTEGMLLREITSDPLLRKYDVVVLDEVHERGWIQDLLMALIRCRTLPQRPDLTLVLMTATIDTGRYAAYFDAHVIKVAGRTHPVTVEYRPELGEEAAGVVAAAIELLGRVDGDIIAFVPDYAMIREVMTLAQEEPALDGIQVLPLYGNQSPAEQQAALRPASRSLIVATNVAETSVTPETAVAAIDTGLVKEMRYYPRTGTRSLKAVPHAKAGCKQRLGRVGRVAPGLCLRLYSRHDYDSRKEYAVPEIRRADLAGTYISALALGFSDAKIRELEFMDEPHGSFWDDARDTLFWLEALDEDGDLTDLGRRMAEMPLPPEISRMLLAAEEYGCVRAVASVAASFTTRPIFLRPIGREKEADAAHMSFRNPTSDFLTLLKVVDRWRAVPEDERAAYAERMFLHHEALEDLILGEQQLLLYLRDCDIGISDGRDKENIGKAVAAGLIARLLVKDSDDGGQTYSGRNCRAVFIAPGSSVRHAQSPTYLVAGDLTETSRLFARNVQVIPARWLEEVFGIETHRHRTPTKARYRKAATRRRGQRGAVLQTYRSGGSEEEE